ncbi:MAG TPA: PDZ domain-containing protein, partial [Longimicrobiaceae bacterium]|nr:PDZ domain-containing protein [Longimicrobiaceae bacterium]
MKRVAILIALGLALVGPAQGQDRADAAQRGWLGISFDPSRQAAGELVVNDVAVDSPADRGGLEPGDRIVRWNGNVDVTSALRDRQLQIGDTVRLRVARDGQVDRDVTVVAGPRRMLVERRVGRDREEIVVRTEEMARRLLERQRELAERMDSLHVRLRVMLEDSLGPRIERFERRVPRIRIDPDTADGLFLFRDGLGMTLAGGRSGVAGAQIADVTPGLGNYFGTQSGALVLRVAPNTPAADAGLQEGDVIVRANGETVDGVDDLRRIVGPVSRFAQPRIFVDGVEVPREQAER